MDNEQRDYAEEEYNRLLIEKQESADWPECTKCGEPIDYCQGHGNIYAWCPWCQSDDAEDYSPHLCRAHLAEYEGLSVDELDRRDREEAYDLL
jgi:hypothetical protein